MKILLLILFFIFSIPLSVSFAQDDYRGTQKFLTGVGKEYDEKKIGFNIEYILEGELSNLINVNND